MNNRELINEAVQAQAKSISPYSNFRVGAALLTSEGKVYQAANVETSSYSLTMCAERNAVFHAVLEGERNFESIAVVCDTDDFCPPCGACRQVMLELCGENLDVIMQNGKNEIKVMKIKDLLPLSFNSEYLNK